ncbi:hypothetical protein, partial [Streptomyces sp. NPDC096068]|uniref:hypothetical protein n=1 Tax=Streptomyces sp. NPDC096068 TaxID=3155424 RepID=UPI003329A4FC
MTVRRRGPPGRYPEPPGGTWRYATETARQAPGTVRPAFRKRPGRTSRGASLKELLSRRLRWALAGVVAAVTVLAV